MPDSLSHGFAAPAGAVGIGWRHPHYRELLERRPPLGFVEVHSENFFAKGGAALATLEQARAHYAVSLHGVGLSLGSVLGIDAWHLDQLERLVRRVEPVRVSDHASFGRGLFKGAVVHAADLLPIPFSRASLDVLCANVQQVQDRLKRRFMVENISSYVFCKPLPNDPPLAEPEFLSTLARRTGCSLLVDVNNIYVNALNAQLGGAEGDPVQHCLRWLDAIAPAEVAEIHLAGHCHVSDEHGDIVIDDHGSRVCPEVWRIYQHALARFGPVPTLIEWDTAIPALDVLLDEAARAGALMPAGVMP
ncbi:MAG: DUF692 domain-containing protein [Rhodoferax sp.]|nr:DUF692 domain-containing protein [Rhodoferax sp.]